MSRLVLFVCPHGAGKSRMAAAFFTRVAPPGWSATSAGLEPDPVVSPRAVRLLAGGEAEPLLDWEPPRPFHAVGVADRLVAIDCAPDGATDHWELRHRKFDAVMRDELRDRAEALAAEVHDG